MLTTHSERGVNACPAPAGDLGHNSRNLTCEKRRDGEDWGQSSQSFRMGTARICACLLSGSVAPPSYRIAQPPKLHLDGGGSRPDLEHAHSYSANSYLSLRLIATLMSGQLLP